MTGSSPPTQAAPRTQFILHPHRSLSSRGFLILMSGISAVSFIAGTVFWMMGAWPVMGFFGLDVLLIFWAFRDNYRAGRAYEVIDVTLENLTLTRVSPKGSREKIEINPYWARVGLSTDHPDGRTSLRIIVRGRELLIGQFLNDDERQEFAEALREALTRARTAAQF